VTQPDHVPLQETDRVRPSYLLPPPQSWYLDRPADDTRLEPPAGPRFGVTGPDLGFGLKLARRLEDRVILTEGERSEDAVAGCFACGARRSATFHRAPVIYDMEWAYYLWGYFGGAPEDMVAWRQPMFRGAGDDYWLQRRIVDAVRPETLRLPPDQVSQRLPKWRELLIT
jgi:hypothetical protein